MRLLYVIMGMSCAFVPLCGEGILSGTELVPSPSSSAEATPPQDKAEKQKSSQGLVWQTNYQDGLAQVRATQKPMFLLFTGSDWCRWCIQLEKEILNQPSFKDELGDQYIFVKIDSPRRKALPEAEEKRNEALRDQYEIEGYPTVLIVNDQEKVLAELSYVEGGVPKFVEELRGLLDQKQSSKSL